MGCVNEKKLIILFVPIIITLERFFVHFVIKIYSRLGE